MAAFEEQIGSILETMINATVTEMTKVIGGSDSTCSEVPSTTENINESSNEKVMVTFHPE